MNLYLFIHPYHRFMRAHGRLANLSIGGWPEARPGRNGPRQKTSLAAKEPFARALAGPLMPASLRRAPGS